MAGDWIKLEHATIDKPEVRQLARLLKKSHAETFVLLLRFWMWIDLNCSNGDVDGVALCDIDDIVTHKGFATALQEVKWLEVEGSPPKIRIPNFEYHMSQSAKKSALNAKRQARWRDAQRDSSSNALVTLGALPEKRRVLKEPRASQAKPVENLCKTLEDRIVALHMRDVMGTKTPEAEVRQMVRSVIGSRGMEPVAHVFNTLREDFHPQLFWDRVRALPKK